MLKNMRLQTPKPQYIPSHTAVTQIVEALPKVQSISVVITGGKP